MDTKDDLVSRLEAKPGMDWRLRAWILHNHGYNNTGKRWHAGAGIAPWKPGAKRPRKK